MSENITLPYVLEWTGNGLHLTEVENSKNNINKVAQISYLPNVLEDDQQVYIQTSVMPVQIEEINAECAPEPEINYLFQVVPSQPRIEMIQPSIEVIQPSLRPLFKNVKQKKKKNKATPAVKRKATSPKEQPKVPKLAPRTRSGRVVKFPKHIIDDFEKLETDDKDTVNDYEVKTSEFPKFLEPPAKSQPNEVQGLEFHQQRRKIAAQYRCPKCQKAYLGKTKMMQHIQKHPDHGPMPQNEKKKINFDVWNFLVDNTQKCSPAQRGTKFCEELTNLLHNLLLLTSALFKKVDHNKKNIVEVDKVLGNAIGLSPGPYSFNENELYKDVTVLQLLTTTDFFRPSETAPEPPADNVKGPSVVTERSKEIAEQNTSREVQKDSEVTHFREKLKDARKSSPKYRAPKMEAEIRSELDIVPEDVAAKPETPHIDSEMLSENSILHLSNIRTSVDELMMTTVDTGGTLLDNSTSSDEVMNVDQFVNERFKRITEPDLEMAGPTLNLDLPSLDLFEFHTS